MVASNRKQLAQEEIHIKIETYWRQYQGSQDPKARLVAGRHQTAAKNAGSAHLLAASFCASSVFSLTLCGNWSVVIGSFQAKYPL